MSGQAQQVVSFEQDGAVGLITLDSPPLNLFTPTVADQLGQAIEQAAQAPIRALVFRAKGRVFSGGVDVAHFEGMTVDNAGAMLSIERVIHGLEDLPFPTIACVHALCLTAGLEVSLACDLMWAAESAQFGQVETVVGVTPFWGGTQRLVERAGPARAREIVYTGGLFDAATFERWNICNRVLPDAELEEKTMRFAQRLANGPTVAHAATKQLVHLATTEGKRAADAKVLQLVAPVLESEDFKGGVKTFVEKGPGHGEFSGR